MKLPNWMKSKARKQREATLERLRQEAVARQDERRRKHEADVAAANTPEKLKETGTAMLIELIRTYPHVQVVNNMYFGKTWRFGNIELNSFSYCVTYREGLQTTDLFIVPDLQEAAVAKALDARYQQLGGKSYVPVSAITPIAAEVAQFRENLKQHVSGMEKDKAEKHEEAAITRYNRELFTRLVKETLGKSK